MLFLLSSSFGRGLRLHRVMVETADYSQPTD